MRMSIDFLNQSQRQPSNNCEIKHEKSEGIENHRETYQTRQLLLLVDNSSRESRTAVDIHGLESTLLDPDENASRTIHVQCPSFCSTPIEGSQEVPRPQNVTQGSALSVNGIVSARQGE
jgi:hypothetical protein